MKCIVFPGQDHNIWWKAFMIISGIQTDEVDDALNLKLTEIILVTTNGIKSTENTQPAIMAVSIATFAV